MPFYSYRCPAGHVTEKKGRLDESSAPCPVCSKPARRREFNLVAIVGETVMKDQRYPVSRYVEASQEVDYHYTKAENDGMPVKRPNLWKIAKREARRRKVRT